MVSDASESESEIRAMNALGIVDCFATEVDSSNGSNPIILLFKNFCIYEKLGVVDRTRGDM